MANVTKIIVKYFLALSLYRLVVIILFPIVLLALFIRSKNNKGYRQGIKQRLGLVPKQFKKNTIVIHAASVGEVLALKPFVEKLLTELPHTNITFTTFTPTGLAQVKQLFDQRVQYCYLPFDMLFSTQLFLRQLQPKLIIFMETELWPNLVAQAKQQQIKLLLINGRISTSSLTQYQKLNWLIKPCLQRFDEILCQSQDNHENFIALGATSEHCRVSGNLKYDLSLSRHIQHQQQELAQTLPNNRPIWVVASTHQGDEAIAVSVYQQLLTQFPSLLLVIAPRHPERFKLVNELLLNAKLNVCSRSSKSPITPQNNVWLLNSLGELNAVYSFATVVTLGGSFSDIGGHNPLEPAFFSKPIIVGSNMSNFNDITQQMLNHQAIIQLPVSTIEQHLITVLTRVLNDPQEANLLGVQAKKVLEMNQGAVDYTLHYTALYSSSFTANG